MKASGQIVFNQLYIPPQEKKRGFFSFSFKPYPKISKKSSPETPQSQTPAPTQSPATPNPEVLNRLYAPSQNTPPTSPKQNQSPQEPQKSIKQKLKEAIENVPPWAEKPEVPIEVAKEIGLKKQDFQDPEQKAKEETNLSNQDATKEPVTDQKSPPSPQQNSNPFDLSKKSPEELKKMGEAEGHKEAVKEQAKEKDESLKKFEQIAEKSKEVLFESSAVFPFDLFPDKVSVDRNQVNIFFNTLFFSGRKHSILIKDISDVLVDSALFFATLRIADKGFTDNFVEIKYLWKEDALKLRRIIQGLMVADRNGIDLNNIDKEMLLQKIEELGKIEK